MTFFVLFVNSGSLYLILGFGWRSDNIQYQKYAKTEKNHTGGKYFFTAVDYKLGALSSEFRLADSHGISDRIPRVWQNMFYYYNYIGK
jgi:hypothetical protein